MAVVLHCAGFLASSFIVLSLTFLMSPNGSSECYLKIIVMEKEEKGERKEEKEDRQEKKMMIDNIVNK